MNVLCAHIFNINAEVLKSINISTKNEKMHNGLEWYIWKSHLLFKTEFMLIVIHINETIIFVNMNV